jgi:integration host factor subunit beta
MTRCELISRLAKANPELLRASIERLVSLFFATIADRLIDGGRVELRGFGSFSTKARRARIGRDPRSGQSVEVLAKRVPAFRPAREMNKILNPEPQTSAAGPMANASA